MSDSDSEAEHERKYPKPKTESFVLDELRIWYEKWGKGKKYILVISGDLAEANTQFEKLKDAIDPEEFTLIYWDPPGFGKARPNKEAFIGIPEEWKEGWIREYARVGFVFMKWHLRFEEFTVAAFSDGGIYGMLMASRFPDNVKKLFLWNTFAKIDDKEKFVQKLEDDKKSWDNKKQSQMEATYGDELETFWADYVREMSNFDGITPEELGKIQCPTVVVAGAKDTFVDPSNVKYIEANIKNCKTVLIPDGGHDLHNEKTQEIAKMITELALQ